jgi:hypothetical protein
MPALLSLRCGRGREEVRKRCGRKKVRREDMEERVRRLPPPRREDGTAARRDVMSTMMMT